PSRGARRRTAGRGSARRRREGRSSTHGGGCRSARLRDEVTDGPRPLDEGLGRRAAYIGRRHPRERVVPRADRWRGPAREQAAETERTPGDRVARERDARQQAAAHARELGLVDRIVGQPLELAEQRVLDGPVGHPGPERRLEREEVWVLR